MTGRLNLLPKTDYQLDALLELDHQIDAAEDDAIRTRWEFGRQLLGQRVGKRLPNGHLEKVVKETGKSSSEIKYRMQFAEAYATEEELATAVASFPAWTDIRDSLSGKREEVGAAMGSTGFECYTPEQYIEAARIVLGEIDLDPASSDVANETVKAARYFTLEDDGLEQRWEGRIWLNPPYGRKLTSDFVAKAVAEFEAGHVTQAILCLNAYGFDAEWCQPLFGHLLCFTDHRIKFYGGSPTFGSLFVYMGDNREGFLAEFGAFGNILERAE